MWTRIQRRLAGFLLVFTLHALHADVLSGSDEFASPPTSTLLVRDCTISFVHKSTYATSRPGIIADLPYEEGDSVQPGSLVVQLRDEVAQANYKLRSMQATIETPIKIAELEQLAADTKRDAAVEANSGNSNAFERVAIAELKLLSDARALQVRQAGEEYDLTQVAEEQAEAELESYRVKAKFGGMVTRVHKRVGEAVNLGDEIITVVDTSRVRVEGLIPYQHVRRLQVGDPVRVRLSLGRGDLKEVRQHARLSASNGGFLETTNDQLPEESEIFSGQIRFIGVETDDDLGEFNEVRVWAEVENRDNILLEGLLAVMAVHLRTR